MERNRQNDDGFQSNHSNNLEHINPKLEDVLISLSSVLQSKIMEDFENYPEIVGSKSMIFFNEDLAASFQAASKEDSYIIDQIFLFVKNLYFGYNLGVECCTLTLSYILRFLKLSNIPLFHGNWTNIVFSATIISQKMCNIDYIKNLEFVTIFPNLSIGDINDMEKEFLKFFGFQYEIRRSFYENCFYIMFSACESELTPKWKIDDDKVDNIFTRMISFSKEMEDIQLHERQICRVDAIILNDDD